MPKITITIHPISAGSNTNKDKHQGQTSPNLRMVGGSSSNPTSKGSLSFENCGLLSLGWNEDPERDAEETAGMSDKTVL